MRETRRLDAPAKPPARSTALVAWVPTPTRARVTQYSRRCGSAAGHMLVLVLAFVVVATGLLYARLAQGPIALDFLAPPIERSVNAELQGLRFDVGGVVLRLGNALGIQVRLRDVALRNDADEVVARSPLAAIGLSEKALMQLAVRPERIDLIGVRLSLQHDAARGLTLAVAGGQFAEGVGEAEQTVLKTAPKAAGGTAEDASAAASLDAGAPAEAGDAGETRAFDLAATLGALFERLQQGAISDLAMIGLRNAEITFEHDGVRQSWAVPEMQLNLDSGAKRRTIAGRLALASSGDAFDVDFKVSQQRQGGRLAIDMTATDIRPSRLAGDFSGLTALRGLDLPISTTLKMELTEAGDVTELALRMALGAGQVIAPWMPRYPMAIEGGLLDARYDRDAGRVILSEARLAWDGGVLRLDGEATASGGTDSRNWSWRVAASEATLGAPEFAAPAVTLDSLTMAGTYDPRGAFALDELGVTAGEASVTLAARITDMWTRPAVSVDGQLKALPAALIKVLWPKPLSPGARLWVGEKVSAGQLTTGTVRVRLDGDTLAGLKQGGDIPTEAVDVRLGLANLAVGYITGLPPLQIANGSAAFIGKRFQFDVPEARIAAAPSETLTLTGGQFIIGDLRSYTQTGEVHFKAAGSVLSVLALLDHPPLGYIGRLGVAIPQVGGDVTSAFSITLPMLQQLKFADLKLAGKANVVNVRASGLPNGLALQRGKLSFDVNDTAIDASGDVVVNGAPVKLAWQRIFDATPDRQPPLRISGVLDDAQRAELGLNVSHVVRGRVPFDLNVAMGSGDAAAPAVHVEADLSAAEVFLTAIGWRKPPGARAILGFDVKQDTAGTTLANFIVTGDEIAIKGDVSLNEAKKPVAFNFPTFALDMLTQMQINGQLGPGNIWKVRADGASYDGRQFFSALFSAGQLAEDQPAAPKGAAGLDLSVEIGSVLGHNDTTLRNVSITAKRRNDKLAALDVAARLNGEAPLAARVEAKDGARVLVAQAADAGAAFRLVGLYAQARRGEASLRVNLDGAGAAEKTGILYVSDFFIADDAVVGEVLAGGEAQGSARAKQARAQAGRGQAVRGQAAGAQATEIQFDRMRVPFSVGHGQFVLHDSAINGPLIGATMRGRIDFGRRNLALSGTYVPMYGLNAAFSGIPILGDLLSGRRGEGIFGITFAVQGAMASPNVLVNPISMVAPGFLRQIFEFDHTPPQVIPPAARRPAPTTGGQRPAPADAPAPSATQPRRPAATGQARGEDATFTR